MQTIFEAETPYTVVSSKKSGKERENSLYHYLSDQMYLPAGRRSNEMQALKCVKSSSAVRDAYFITLSLSEESLKKELATFGDFTLRRLHLSVDRLHALESAQSHHAWYTANHITVTLQSNRSPEDGKVIHIHFDPQGQITRNPFRMVACRLNAVSGHIVSRYTEALALTENNKREVLSHLIVTKYQECLRELLTKKSSTYADLLEESFKMSDTLAKQVTVESLSALKSLTEKMTRYSDTTIDGRTTYLAQYIQRLEMLHAVPNPVIEINPTIADEETPDTITVEETFKRPTRRERLHATLLSVQNELEPVWAQIELLNTQLSAKPLDNDLESKNAWLHILKERELKLRDLEESLLYLECSTHSLPETAALTAFYRNKCKNLEQKRAYDYFEQAIGMGDLNTVKALHTFLSQFYHMQNVYHSLINTILFAESDSDIANVGSKANIAQLFYEESSLYRAIIMFFQRTARANLRDGVQHGMLLTCYLNNNFAGFCMLTQQGFDPSYSPQLILKGQPFTGLQAICIMYEQNTSETRLQYVQHLLEQYPLFMQFIRLARLTNDAAYQVPTLVNPKKIALKKVKNVDLSAGSSIFDLLLKNIEQSKNPIDFLQCVHFNPPQNLICLILTYIPIEERTLFAAKILFNKPWIVNRTVFGKPATGRLIRAQFFEDQMSTPGSPRGAQLVTHFVSSMYFFISDSISNIEDRREKKEFGEAILQSIASILDTATPAEQQDLFTSLRQRMATETLATISWLRDRTQISHPNDGKNIEGKINKLHILCMTLLLIYSQMKEIRASDRSNMGNVLKSLSKIQQKLLTFGDFYNTRLNPQVKQYSVCFKIRYEDFCEANTSIVNAYSFFAKDNMDYSKITLIRAEDGYVPLMPDVDGSSDVLQTAPKP